MYSSALRTKEEKVLFLYGNKSEAYTADPSKNEIYQFRYKVIDIDDLIASHDSNLNPNTNYPQELQPRLRDRAASKTQVERFHGTLKSRTKVMRGLKNLESAIEFTQGWLVHYNYLRPHESLKDKTPAEVAGVDYPYENWADIIRKHTPSVKVTIVHQPRGKAKLPRIQVGRPKKVRISEKAPRITPKMQRLAK